MRNFKSLAVAAALCMGLAAPAFAQTLNAYVAPDGVAKTLVAGVSPMPVSGRTSIVTITPTVTAASAYAAGQVIGGLMTFTSLATLDNPTGLIQSVGVHFKSAQTPPLDFVFCGANPTASTITDKTALAIAAADFTKCRAFHITDCTSLGTPSYCGVDGLASPFILAGTDGYGVLVARSAFTFASTSDVAVSLRAVH